MTVDVLRADPNRVLMPQASMGIDHVGPEMGTLVISPDQMPWLHQEQAVHLRQLYLLGGAMVWYGSIIGGNNTLRQLASNVSSDRSLQAQTTLFKELPEWLSKCATPNIDRVSRGIGNFSVHKTTSGRRNPARLFFVNPCRGSEATVVRIAIANHNDQGRAVNIFTDNRKSLRPRHYS